MLKRFFLDNKEIPVPIPILTLGDAVQWIKHSFVKEGMALTSLSLDGEQLVEDLVDAKIGKRPLTATSQLVVKIDSPKSLSVQTLDAIRDLSFVIQRLMKEMGVEVWQGEEIKHVKCLDTLNEISADVKLILELIDHLNGLTDYTHEDLAPINGLAHLLRRYTRGLDDSIAAKMWKEVANLLVNRFDYYLKEMVLESEKLQFSILTLVQPVLEQEAKGA